MSAPTMSATAGQRLEHRIGPGQLLLSELLVLPAARLEQRVAAELDANLALETAPAPACPRCARPAWSGVCRPCDGRLRERVDRRSDPLGRLAVTTTSRERLLADAARGLSAAERLVAAHVLAEVDDLGLMADPVSAVAARLGLTACVVHRVIGVLRAAGAPGLGATELVERLRLQVSAGGADVPPEVGALVERGLRRLADDSAADVAAACDLSPEQLRSALDWFRSHVAADLFTPHDTAVPVVVDIVVRREAGRFLVDAVSGPWSGLRVAESYLAGAGPLVDGDIARARRFIDGLSRRTSMLLRVAQAVVARQSERVVHGPRAHLPLCRRDVAVELGVHESTVSRAVAGKHLLLPSGETVAFGALFGAAMGVQHCLRDIVTLETVPLSDAELSGALAARGHRLARRTVAKHRTALGIPPQHLR